MHLFLLSCPLPSPSPLTLFHTGLKTRLSPLLHKSWFCFVHFSLLHIRFILKLTDCLFQCNGVAGGAEGVGPSIPLKGLSSLRSRVERRKRSSRVPQRKCVAVPVEGVNFQAVKDLKSLASAATLTGPASASKWLSTQTRLPGQPPQLYPLFHHPLDVKSTSFFGAYLGNNFYFDSSSAHTPPHGSLKIWTPPIWDPLGDYAERAGQKTEQQEMFESGNVGSSHPSAPHAIPCPGTCFLGSDAPCKSPCKVWQHPHSVPLAPSSAPRKD